MMRSISSIVGSVLQIFILGGVAWRQVTVSLPITLADIYIVLILGIFAICFTIGGIDYGKN